MTVSIVFFLIALIISIGFFGKWLFKVTRVPDALLLIGAGFALRTLTGVDSEIFQLAAPFFGAFALVVILFEGGLHLEFHHLLKSWKNALTLMSLVFTVSLVLVAALMHMVFRYPLLNAAVLGAALACTSAAIIIPLIREVKVNQELKTVLELESSLSDAFAVLITVTLLSIALDSNANSQIGMLIFSSLTGSLIIGTVAGFAWTWLMGKYLGGQQLTYLMTFAVMLLVYAVCEFVHSSGVFGVFLFGLAYSNGPHLLSRFWPKPRQKQKVWDDTDTDVDIRSFHAELTFLVRTFFFVFLGLIFEPKEITLMLLTQAVSIYIMILAARYMVVKVIHLKGTAWEQRHSAKVLFLFMPRGLASAVLATLPIQYGLTGTASFVNITVLIILFTNLAITFGVRHIEKAAPDIIEKTNDTKAKSGIKPK
ncbi:cation:proton antiporter [bacterium]|nr:cation:proton antiporter [bacterium]MBU1920586.1 cation:proton antiporter [bacterium]